MHVAPTETVSDVFNESVNLEVLILLYVNVDNDVSVIRKYELKMRSSYAKFFEKNTLLFSYVNVTCQDNIIEGRAGYLYTS